MSEKTQQGKETADSSSAGTKHTFWRGAFSQNQYHVQCWSSPGDSSTRCKEHSVWGRNLTFNTGCLNPPTVVGLPDAIMNPQRKCMQWAWSINLFPPTPILIVSASFVQSLQENFKIQVQNNTFISSKRNISIMEALQKPVANFLMILIPCFSIILCDNLLRISHWWCNFSLWHKACDRVPFQEKNSLTK